VFALFSLLKKLADNSGSSLPAIGFEKRDLEDTWFSQLNLSGYAIEPRRIPKKEDHPLGWAVAVNLKHRVLFTQLVSNTGEMRERVYYYLLAIGPDIVVIEWNDPTARILPGLWSTKYSSKAIRQCADAAAMLITSNRKRFKWR